MISYNVCLLVFFFDLLTYFVLSLCINRYRTAGWIIKYAFPYYNSVVLCVFNSPNEKCIFTFCDANGSYCKLYEDTYDRNQHCFIISVTRYLIPMSIERDFYEEVIQIYYILMNRNMMWSNRKKTTEDDVPAWSPFYQRKQNKTYVQQIPISCS